MKNESSFRREKRFGCSCPSDEELSLFVERRLPDSSAGFVAMHIATCPGCSANVRDVAEWLAAEQDFDMNAVTLEERNIVSNALGVVHAQRIMELWQKVFAAVKPACAYIAAADGQTPDQIQQRNTRAGILHFVSTPPPPHKDSWHVKVTLPAETGLDDTYIRLQVFDVDECVIPSGVLTFCGIDLNIEDGYAFMSMGEFRRNMRVTLIKLKRSDRGTVPGELTAVYGI